MTGKILMGSSHLQGRRSAKAFTLIELLVVITIISILVSVILLASYDGVRTANLKATQALVLKLDLAVKERMQALLDDEVKPNATHIWLATPAANKPPSVATVGYGAMRGLSPGRAGNARAKAIAMTDYLRAEMPDVFVLNGMDVAGFYPINFGGIPQAKLGSVAPLAPNASVAPYTLPIGTAMAFDGTSSFGAYYPPLPGQPTNPANKSYNDSYNFSGTGVFGASYTAAAGIYKQLGYGPAGYDGVDNNANGLVDEKAEGAPFVWDGDGTDNDGNGSVDEQNEGSNYVAQLLQNHTHKTARSEMLYALLVEGQGPLGAAFSRDEFTDREIQDTDNDGLLEFVDAYGEPLQFYRWPMWYTSDNQRGWAEYPSDPWVQRDRDTSDPSNSLVSLDWWNDNVGNGNDRLGLGRSIEAQVFEYFFHPLTEACSFQSNTSYWDRTGSFRRRAFRYTPLVISGGPDLRVGIRTYGDITEQLTMPEFLRDYENLAVKFDYYAFSYNDLRYSANTVTGIPSNIPLSDDLLSSAEDDISSHAMSQGLGGGAK